MPAKQEPRRASDSRSELIRWMSIQDANSAGFVHGGVVMKLVDEVAGLAAVRHARRRVVTAGVAGEPLARGDGAGDAGDTGGMRDGAGGPAAGALVDRL